MPNSQYITTYTVDPNTDILHKTLIDFTKRVSIPTIHIVQYDNTLPIVEVELFNNYENYILPNNCNVYIRWSLKDGEAIYKKVLGCSIDRKKVYFAIDKNMVKYPGSKSAILEVIIDEQFIDSDDEHTIYPNRIAGSSPLYFEIDRNPIPIPDLQQYINDNVLESNNEPDNYNYIIVTTDTLSNYFTKDEIRELLSQYIKK